MNIASNLINWLQGFQAQQNQAQQTSSNAQIGKAPDPAAVSASKVAESSSSVRKSDSVEFSEIAQKLSESNLGTIDVQISPEEREALFAQTEPQTYKPSLMQVARKIFGFGEA
ncbi:MAG: hypothetical protein AB7F20_03810 [Geoalkalibacter sp.]|jgi:hypothetical protein|uniref:hypothetical protein n=1 Tax=Geoalkalibacter sp. TaxID=3041440 RepID=UPI002A98F4CE|nr:hypothetical protein [Thermodesulfobacteriota bacterium]